MGGTNEIKPVIRKLKKHESAVLREIFYHAIFMPEDAVPLPFSIVDHPDLVKYHTDWGREGDIAFVAESEGKCIGAAWCRLWKDRERGYGFIAEDIPELSMAVLPEFRSMGVGTDLLKELFSAVKSAGFKALSISVEKRNPATSLYLRLGFTVVKDKFPDYTMQISL